MMRRRKTDTTTVDVTIADNRIRIGPASAAFVLRRSNRARRVSLRIDPGLGQVTLVLPGCASEAAGFRFVARNASWLARRLACLEPRIAFADGADVPLAGRPHRIRHRPGTRGTVWLEGPDEIHIAGAAEHLPRRLIDWLKRRARIELTDRAMLLAARIGVKVTRVQIRDPRTRWGSCGPDGHLSFSWRLIMAPEIVIDYVAAHEVAHLIHPHHGPAFWRLTDSIAADAGAARQWLRRHGARLHRYG